MPSTSSVDGYHSVALAQLGPDLSGRGLGGDLRRYALELTSDEITFDFKGIEAMSPSFADEAFGKLAVESNRPRIKIVNATPDIVATIRFAVRNRADAGAQPVPA